MMGPHCTRWFLTRNSFKFCTRIAGPRCLCSSSSSKPSYWHNPGSEPLFASTVGKIVDQSAERYPDREALVSVHQGHRLTFHEVRQQADRLAAGLWQLGLRPGDRLALWSPNSSEWVLSYFAAARAGLILVNINPAYQSPELAYCLNKVGVKALIAADTFKTQDYHRLLLQVVPEVATSQPGCIRSQRVPSLESFIVIGDKELPGAFQFSEIMSGGTPEAKEALKRQIQAQQPDEGSNIQFTSGTTGSPKAALLSHHNIINNCYFFGKRLGLHLKQHRLCAPVPLFHTFGNTLGITAMWYFGATLVLPSPSFSAASTLEAIRQERCTIVYGTPTMHVDVISTAREAGATMPSIELIITAGAVTSEHLFSELLKVYGNKRIYSVFGMTETSPVSFQPMPDTPAERLTNTVGFVSDHLEVKVVDTEGRMVPMGCPGELWVRGYSTMLGYWGDEEKTDATIRPDRWLRTGDQFVLLEDGYGKVVGRLKDMIIRGGENIFPKEIEDLLDTHPDILEVQVFGVPDERLGEVVCCCARLKPGACLTAEQLRAYCTGKIAHFKIPQHVRFVSNFPKTISGKIQKFKLQEQLAQELCNK